MTVKDFVSMVCQEQEITQTALADRLGIKKQNLKNTLSRDNGMGMRLSTFIKWLDRMEYQLVVEPLNGGDEAIIDGDDDSFLFGEE